MAKKKVKTKNKPTVVVGDGTRVDVPKRDSGILDISAPEMILDVTAKDEEKTIEGILNTNLSGVRNDVTFSFRINGEIWKHIKQITRDISAKKETDMNYQKLMVSTFLDRYPMKGEK